MHICVVLWRKLKDTGYFALNHHLFLTTVTISDSPHLTSYKTCLFQLIQQLHTVLDSFLFCSSVYMEVCFL